MFVDDVLLFGMIIRSIWRAFHEIFIRFCAATGMIANNSKSCIYFGEGENQTILDVGELFNFKTEPFSMGFKFLGFYLKPNNYVVDDWSWLIEKVDKRISDWTTK